MTDAFCFNRADLIWIFYNFLINHHVPFQSRYFFDMISFRDNALSQRRLHLL